MKAEVVWSVAFVLAVLLLAVGLAAKAAPNSDAYDAYTVTGPDKYGVVCYVYANRALSCVKVQ